MIILIFGATGSAGAAVLKACLSASIVKEVRAVVRRPLDVAHPKLRTYIHDDFLNHASITDVFTGVDACLFCLGISVTQVSEETAYRRITHDFALAAAHALHAGSPGAAFHFISGAGTNENGRSMWARVKGLTERELMEGFGAVCWRIAAVHASPSKNAPWYYKVFIPLVVLLKPFRNLYVKGEDLGRAMLQATIEKMRSRVLENAEIRDIADRAGAL